MPGPRHPALGRLAGSVWKPFATRRFARRGMFGVDSTTATNIFTNLRQRVQSGESCYIAGLGISGHNSGISLVRVSRSAGIELLSNDEEERFCGLKHFGGYPEQAVDQFRRRLNSQGVRPDQVAAWVTSWDYSNAESLLAQTIVEEFPANLEMLKPGAADLVELNPVEQCRKALEAPALLAQQLGLEKTPQLIMISHHENHASFSYAASPFAKTGKPTMITVVDGTGDTGAISHFLGENGAIRELYSNRSLSDSLGGFYTTISATQGGWTPLSSEGRYMGAVAWGDQDRLSNPYYRRLREIFHFGPKGELFLNRSMANWQIAGGLAPYTPALEAIIGPPILADRMWNPDAVLNVDSVKHSEITRTRVDIAAATQLVFEDCIFHMVEHLIRTTGSDQLVMTGGTALNGLCSMKLLEHFDHRWYKHNLEQDTRLKLWVPPTPGDSGVSIGAAYSAALRSEVPVGDGLQHAAWCGIPAQTSVIEKALDSDAEIHFHRLGNIKNEGDRLKLADLMAFVISQDGVLGLYQGSGETGPRALGQRSILANPCNPDTRLILNERVKFREAIRPLAPMVTRDQADKWFELSDGAAADDYNAYRYMVLTTKARPVAYHRVPSIIHKDGTCRIQIVTPDTNPLVYDYLKAMGRRVGAQVSVNTSLNVGGPICQTPDQAVATLKKAKGMTALVMVSDNSEAFLVWHGVQTAFKDNGQQLQEWLSEHEHTCHARAAAS